MNLNLPKEQNKKQRRISEFFFYETYSLQKKIAGPVGHNNTSVPQEIVHADRREIVIFFFEEFKGLGF